MHRVGVRNVTHVNRRIDQFRHLNHTRPQCPRCLRDRGMWVGLCMIISAQVIMGGLSFRPDELLHCWTRGHRLEVLTLKDVSVWLIFNLGLGPIAIE